MTPQRDHWVVRQRREAQATEQAEVKTQLMGQTHREDLGPRQADRGDRVVGLMEEAQVMGTDRQVGKVLAMGQTEG